jgi:hypothetical protein
MVKTVKVSVKTVKVVRNAKIIIKNLVIITDFYHFFPIVTK